MVVQLAIIAVIALIFLPSILNFAKKVNDSVKTNEEIQQEALEEKERKQKGAVANTFDFLFGDEFTKETKEFLEGKSQEQITKRLEKSASEALDRQVNFDGNIIVTKNGIISSDSPPTFTATQADKDAILQAQIRSKNLDQILKKLGISITNKDRLLELGIINQKGVFNFSRVEQLNNSDLSSFKTEKIKIESEEFPELRKKFSKRTFKL